MISEIRAQEIKIAIDYFGTGYFSLLYLQMLYLDLLKIDKSYINHWCQSNNSSGFWPQYKTRKYLKFEMVVEGVEAKT